MLTETHATAVCDVTQSVSSWFVVSDSDGVLRLSIDPL